MGHVFRVSRSVFLADSGPLIDHFLCQAQNIPDRLQRESPKLKEFETRVESGARVHCTKPKPPMSQTQTVLQTQRNPLSEPRVSPEQAEHKGTEERLPTWPWSVDRTQRIHEGKPQKRRWI